jgi:hypothetical protein
MQGFCGSIPVHGWFGGALLVRRGVTKSTRRKICRWFRQTFGIPSRHKYRYLFRITSLMFWTKWVSWAKSRRRNWCEKATESYQISIEVLPSWSWNISERKGNNHHVVFLVDETGKHRRRLKMMLNLQTVTEDLGTAWQGKRGSL